MNRYRHYYNEFDPKAAAMLRQMMKDGLLEEGFVDERSITEIHPDELKGYVQCHFFAGIGGWQFALQEAGWPADREVWTGSCPCQPFSSAGRQKGKDDERHLWPVWFSLIKECNPATIFGEQVATAVTKGWLDDVFQDLESQNYAIGAAVLPASAVGAPHKRDRLWFVGDTKLYGYVTTTQQGSDETPSDNRRTEGSNLPWELTGASAARYVSSVQGMSSRERKTCTTVAINVADTEIIGSGECGNSPQTQGGRAGIQTQSDIRSSSSDVADTKQPRLQEQGELVQPVNSETSEVGQTNRPEHDSPRHWDNAQWLECPDGKFRPVEPSIPLLVDGFQHRKPILHAIGNAIVPQVAAEFIGAYMELNR